MITSPAYDYDSLWCIFIAHWCQAFDAFGQEFGCLSGWWQLAPYYSSALTAPSVRVGDCRRDVRYALFRVKKRQISSQPTAQGVWKPTLDLEGRLQWLNGHPKAAGQRQQPQHARPPAAERYPPLAAESA